MVLEYHCFLFFVQKIGFGPQVLEQFCSCFGQIFNSMGYITFYHLWCNTRHNIKNIKKVETMST